MRDNGLVNVLAGQLMDDDAVLSLDELCRLCDAPADWIREMVEEGILDPQTGPGADWFFTGACLYRARVVTRLQRDLGVNLSGAAVALELIEEIRRLRARLDPDPPHSPPEQGARQ